MTHHWSFVQADQLAQMMLYAAACGNSGAIEQALDYFESINTTPLAERHPSLGKPLYSALLPIILQAASYPDDFTDWESYTQIEEETFHQLR